MLVFGGVHIGAQLVSGGPESFFKVLQSATGLTGGGFTAGLFLWCLSFGAGGTIGR
ncbi:hypothetical protein D3C76_1571060 [compost metagenome]